MSEQSEKLREILKALLAEADRLLDEIDEMEAKILQLEAEEDANEGE